MLMAADDSDKDMRGGVRLAMAAMFVKVFRALVRVALRHGLSAPELEEILRWTYVDVVTTDDEFRLRHKQTDSRAAMLTGLSRKEVRRLKLMPPPHQSEQGNRYTNRAARVINGWTEDSRFSDGKDKAKRLSLKNDNPAFEDLVQQYGADVPPKTVLDELLRCGLAEVVDGEWLSLTQTRYIPPSGTIDQFEIMGMCASDLIATMERNWRPGCDEKFPQTAVYSVTLPQEAMPLLRQSVAQHVREFAREMHHRIYDHSEKTQTPAPDHQRAGIGIYYFES